MLVYYGSSEGFKYIVFMIWMTILCYSDVFFLERLKNDNQITTDKYNNKISVLQLLIMFFILLEILFKWKISSIITSFAGGKSYLLNIFVMFCFIIPIFMTYDLKNKNQTEFLKIYHYINLAIKALVIILAVLPKTQKGLIIKFFKSGYYNLNNYKFSKEKC
ncbi:hypothetical protein CPAV1605_422 [seawater metagenome]|uniref:Uncharacterized protein n=1 Tax=seawater metagenome TaxID=1561972 RepID=A0A5E8CI01_9ZZZZ